MKSKLKLLTAVGVAAQLLWLSGASAWAAPGTITASAPPGPYSPGDTVVVDVGISGYTDAAGIDTWQLVLNWDPSLLSYSSIDYDLTGDQWLAKAAQDAPAVALFPATTPGASSVTFGLTDFVPPFGDLLGTTAGSGRLAKISLTVDSPGPPSATVTPLTLSSFGSGILLEADALATTHAAPGLAGSSITIIPEPSCLALLCLTGTALLLCRRR